jgi:hypothetical protein
LKKGGRFILIPTQKQLVVVLEVINAYAKRHNVQSVQRGLTAMAAQALNVLHAPQTDHLQQNMQSKHQISHVQLLRMQLSVMQGQVLISPHANVHLVNAVHQ